eukprot:3289244-Pyramimonas_sp.AAC.1
MTKRSGYGIDQMERCPNLDGATNLGAYNYNGGGGGPVLSIASVVGAWAVPAALWPRKPASRAALRCPRSPPAEAAAETLRGHP